MGRGLRIVIAVVAAFTVSVFSTRGSWPLGGLVLAICVGFVVWFLIGSFRRAPQVVHVVVRPLACKCPPEALHCTCQTGG